MRPGDVAFDGSAASDYERRNRVRVLDVTERKPYRSVPEPSEREPMTSANQACWAALVRRERDRDAYWSQRDPIWRDRLAWQAQSFRHLTHLLPGEAIIELGAGQGWFTRALVQVSRGRNPITAVTFDAEKAPLAAESPVVERILWNEPSGALAGRRFRYAVVQNLLDRDNAPQLLRMVFELLEDGGECVFFESNPWNPVFALRDALKRLFARPRAQHLLSRRELEPLVSEAGFADVMARFTDFVYAPLTPQLVWLLRNLSILLENAPGVRALAGRILVHARKPSGDAPRDQVPLVRHDNLRGAVSVVVPCHDEEMNVRALADGLRAHFGDYVCQIVLVDDNSTDSTRAAIEALAADDARIVPVIRTPPSGVGRALADGFRAASGRYILSMDCDFQHLLPELEDMFDAAAAGADAVFGSRFSRHSVLIDYPFTKILANRAFHVIVNGLFRLRRRDLTNNLKLVRTDIVKRLHLSETGFAANAEIGVKLALSGCTLQEVPVSWINRDRDMGRSSFSLWRSGGGYLRILGRVALATRFGSRPWVGRDGEA